MSARRKASPLGPIHSTFSAANSTQVRVSEPECLRQLSQKQVCGRPGRPVARNLTAPQRQPPSYCFGFICVQECDTARYATPNAAAQ